MSQATPALGQPHIRITDALFSYYSALVAEKMLPYQWATLSDRSRTGASHCLDNFRIAAGELDGRFRGVVFQDSELYKWIEAASYCLENGSVDAFSEALGEAVALVARAQAEDGYINTYYMLEKPDERWTNLAEGHELYCAGHLIEAAVAHHEATGDHTLLHVARRFADLICATFGRDEGQIKGYPGHQEIEVALIKLYRETGDKKYLDCAGYFISERGKRPNYLLEELRARNGNMLFNEFEQYNEEYAQTHLPPIEQRTAEGHAVRAMYMFAAMADLAKETGDEEMLQTCKALWDNVTKRRMYITGSVGSSGILERFTVDYDLPNNSCYGETCASIGLMMFGVRMASATGDAGYYDAVERALYNTVLGSISMHGDRYFYVNPLEVWPAACKDATSMAHVKPVRQPWFRVACCPPNAARTLASLGRYIYTEDERGAWVQLYISSEARLDCGLTIWQDSSLMRDGAVTLRIVNEQSSARTLRLRVPHYAHSPAFSLDGQAISPALALGYAAFTIPPFAEVTLQAAFHVVPQFVAAHNDVRADAGRIALVKGPVVYCLEEQDNGDHLSQIAVRPDALIREHAAADGLPGDLPIMTYEASRIKSAGADGDALYRPAMFERTPLTAKAVPYCLWGNRRPGEMLVWQRAEL